MRRSRPIVPYALLALMALSLPAMARTSPLAGPNGEQGECTEAAGSGDVADAVDARPAAKRATPRPTTKARPAVPFRGEGGGAGRGAPRWHRFLPGMFR